MNNTKTFWICCSYNLKISAVQKGEEPQVQGDFNAKVGDDQHSSWSEVMGKLGLDHAYDRGQQLLQFCAINDLDIANTVVQHVNTRRGMWMSPDGGTMNQIDYILVQRKLKGQLKNCSTSRSAELGSDHFLVIAYRGGTEGCQSKEVKESTWCLLHYDG